MAILNIYEARVRLTSLTHGIQIVQTRVMAQNSHQARVMIESQYGAGTVISDLRLVKG